MSAEPLTVIHLLPERPDLTVLEGGRSPVKRGRPSIADELRLELESRAFEELSFHAQAEPLLRRLEVVARASGPVTFKAIAALMHLHERHGRRWLPEMDDAA